MGDAICAPVGLFSKKAASSSCLSPPAIQAILIPALAAPKATPKYIINLKLVSGQVSFRPKGHSARQLYPFLQLQQKVFTSSLNWSLLRKLFMSLGLLKVLELTGPPLWGLTCWYIIIAYPAAEAGGRLGLQWENLLIRNRSS